MLVESITTSQATEIVPVTAPKTEPMASKQVTDASSGQRQDVELLQDVLNVAQNHFEVTDVGLNFSVDTDTGRVKVSVTDKETGDVIREIPPEQVLNLMAQLDEMMGILFDKKA